MNHYPFLNSHTAEAYVVRPTVALVPKKVVRPHNYDTNGVFSLDNLKKF